MKIAGKKIVKFNEEVVVIPRSGIIDGEEQKDIIFKFHPVRDLDEFEKLCPEPKPPMNLYPGETTPRPDFEDEDYKKESVLRNSRLILYLFLTSIRATPDLEFETVKFDDPATWNKVNQEFLDSGLVPAEINLLYAASAKVNCLNDAAIEEAKKRFLAGELAKSKLK